MRLPLAKCILDRVHEWRIWKQIHRTMTLCLNDAPDILAMIECHVISNYDSILKIGLFKFKENSIDKIQVANSIVGTVTNFKHRHPIDVEDGSD